MDERIQALIDAATRLLEARDDQMITSDEWDALRIAVDAFREPEPHN